MNEIAKQTPSIANFLSFDKTKKFLDDTLKEKRSEFVSNLIALTDSDSNLQICEPAALMKCAMNAVALNLPLNKNLGYAYVIAYKGVPSFQIGYKGFVQMALRTEMYEFFNAVEIREGEMTRNKITGEIKFHGENPSGKIVGYVAYLKLKSGFQASLYMSEEQIESHARKFSKSYQYDISQGKKSSKWSDPDVRLKMALKTVLKGLLSTYGVMSTELQKAFENDSHQEEEEETTTFREVTEKEVKPQIDNSQSVEIIEI